MGTADFFELVITALLHTVCSCNRLFKATSEAEKNELSRDQDTEGFALRVSLLTNAGFQRKTQSQENTTQPIDT